MNRRMFRSSGTKPLDPVRLDESRGFGRAERRRIETLVGERETFLVRAWHEYFGN